MFDKKIVTPTPVDMITDCQSLVDNCRKLRIRAEVRRLLGEISSLKEAIKSGEVRSLTHVGTEFMLEAMAGTIFLPPTDINSSKIAERSFTKK